MPIHKETCIVWRDYYSPASVYETLRLMAQRSQGAVTLLISEAWMRVV